MPGKRTCTLRVPVRHSPAVNHAAQPSMSQKGTFSLHLSGEPTYRELSDMLRRLPPSFEAYLTG
jgi:hypothetical protein